MLADLLTFLKASIESGHENSVISRPASEHWLLELCNSPSNNFVIIRQWCHFINMYTAADSNVAQFGRLSKEKRGPRYLACQDHKNCNKFANNADKYYSCCFQWSLLTGHSLWFRDEWQNTTSYIYHNKTEFLVQEQLEPLAHRDIFLSKQGYFLYRSCLSV